MDELRVIYILKAHNRNKTLLEVSSRRLIPIVQSCHDFVYETGRRLAAGAGVFAAGAGVFDAFAAGEF